MSHAVQVDKGVVVLPGTDGESETQGIDDLGKRCAPAWLRRSSWAQKHLAWAEATAQRFGAGHTGR